MAAIRLDDVHKTYPNGHVAARGLNLEVADGELVVLVGPSGCGKSTALRIVAGLETPTRGRVFIGDQDVTDVAPQDRDIAMVFQSYALYPHKTVRENLAFGLRMRRTPGAVIAERVAAAARTLGLEELLDRKPAQLSGGQRQRVALGRAIVREPRAFLLDEPLSNLDAKLRVETRAELARMHRALGATMLYVTHDQEEAMTLGDRVAVMHGGSFQQIAPPMEIYLRPANTFVAGFIGSPAMNFTPCALAVDGGRATLQSSFFTLELEGAPPSAPQSDRVELGIRPQDIEIAGPGEGDVTATVEVVEPLGSALLVHAAGVFGRRGSGPVMQSAAGRDVRRLELRLVASPDTPVREDETIELRFRRDRLHLFDAETGRRLN